LVALAAAAVVAQPAEAGAAGSPVQVLEVVAAVGPAAGLVAPRTVAVVAVKTSRSVVRS